MSDECTEPVNNTMLYEYYCCVFSQALGHSGPQPFQPQEDVDSPRPVFQKWVGKDYYNPFVKDFIDLDQPHEGREELCYVLVTCVFLLSYTSTQ